MDDVKPLFTVTDEDGNVVAGLARIEADNALLMRFILDVQLRKLDIGQATHARISGDAVRSYWVERVA